MFHKTNGSQKMMSHNLKTNVLVMFHKTTESQKMMLQHKIDMLKLEAEHNKIDADIMMSKDKDKMEIHKAHLDHAARLTDMTLKDHQHERQIKSKQGESQHES